LKILRDGSSTSAVANSTHKPSTPVRPSGWKVLVVDDEPDVRQLTALNLRGFEFAGRPLELIEAASAAEAKVRLEEHKDIALALIDVVMETDDAGLKLVEYIRKGLGNAMVRLVIRTGQPGVAPERYVIDNFDIDDYKDKTELTAQKLYTTVRSALKSFRDLQTIELNRLGLSRILEVTPELYNLHVDKLEEYFRGVLMQIIGLCNLGHSGMISTIDGLVVTIEGKEVCIRAGAGELTGSTEAAERRQQIIQLCSQIVTGKTAGDQLRGGAMVMPLSVHGEVLGFVYLEAGDVLSSDDRELIQVMANQCAAALDNFRLHHSLEESYDQAIDMLGQAAEFKDSATGTHIRRIQEYTRRLALELGVSEAEAAIHARASRLHDVGKVGIPDNILRKPGRLNESEFAVIQRHTHIGDSILKRSPSLASSRIVARSHHERWDGTGYPDRLAGEAIPLSARIVAVVDVFDALVSHRPYKGTWGASKAIDEIRRGSGSHFDPRIAESFISLFDRGELNDLIAAANEQANEASISGAEKLFSASQ
jgi:response regulator RpfG family c-di-GMP phosphodiesterase